MESEHEGSIMIPINTLIEVAERAFWRGEKSLEFRRPMKVGEEFESLPEDVKESLRNLKSDDLRNILSARSIQPVCQGDGSWQ
jgi:hypothetical protein